VWGADMGAPLRVTRAILAGSATDACKCLPALGFEEPLHNSLRSARARARAVHGVAFLANSHAIGCKKRLVAYPDPHQRILARVLQSFPRSLSDLEIVGCKSTAAVHF
jgi:hypothetical protein